MSVPVEVDFAIIKVGDGGGTEVFAIACGLQDVNINRTANTSDRFVRDCAAPGLVPARKTRNNGKQLDVTGSGLSSIDMIPIFDAALGVVKNYRIELYAVDGTSTGDLLGTYAGAFRMTAANLSTSLEGESSAEITLANHGLWTYTAAA